MFDWRLRRRESLHDEFASPLCPNRYVLLGLVVRLPAERMLIHCPRKRADAAQGIVALRDFELIRESTARSQSDDYWTSIDLY